MITEEEMPFQQDEMDFCLDNAEMPQAKAVLDAYRRAVEWPTEKSVAELQTALVNLRNVRPRMKIVYNDLWMFMEVLPTGDEQPVSGFDTRTGMPMIMIGSNEHDMRAKIELVREMRKKGRVIKVVHYGPRATIDDSHW